MREGTPRSGPTALQPILVRLCDWEKTVPCSGDHSDVPLPKRAETARRRCARAGRTFPPQAGPPGSGRERARKGLAAALFRRWRSSSRIYLPLKPENRRFRRGAKPPAAVGGGAVFRFRQRMRTPFFRPAAPVGAFARTDKEQAAFSR